MKVDKTKEAFQIIRQFESKGVLESKYTKIHKGKTITAGKLSSIALTVRQGREFFEAASASDYLTRPIQLYYGISAFSRAMTMFLELSTGEDSLVQSHGLAPHSWPKRISSASDLLNLEIELTGGAFSQWAATAFQHTAMRANISKPNLFVPYDVPEVGSVVSIGQLLSLIPETWDDLSQVTGNQYVRIAYDPNETTLPKNIWGLTGKTSPSIVASCFPVVNSSEITHLNNMNWKVNAEAYPEFNPQVLQDNEDGFSIGTTLVVPPLGDLRLPPLAIYFILAYSLSMLARYRPSIWGGVWNLGSVDGAYPVLERSMQVIQTWYPYVLSENLTSAITKSQT